MGAKNGSLSFVLQSIQKFNNTEKAKAFALKYIFSSTTMTIVKPHCFCALMTLSFIS